MAEREALLDPTGAARSAAATVLAPRLRSLDGLRLGLLDNTKPNALVLLNEVARQLQLSHGIRTVTPYTKGYFGTPVEETQMQRILKDCDFVVAGVGD